MGENDINQTELGRIIGVTQQPVSARLAGEKPFNTDELEAIAEHLDIPITDLLPPIAERRSTDPETRNRWSSSAASAELAAV